MTVRNDGRKMSVVFHAEPVWINYEAKVLKFIPRNQRLFVRFNKYVVMLCSAVRSIGSHTQIHLSL